MPFRDIAGHAPLRALIATAAARGTLRVRNGRVSGELGGRRVRGPLGPDLLDLTFELFPDT